MSNPKPMKMVTISGGSKDTLENEELAYKVGFILGRRGWTVVTGAGPSIMEAVSKGNFEAGKEPIGIVPEFDISRINKYVIVPITTGFHFNRNCIVSNCTPVMIAIGGSFGTLNEVSASAQYQKPVILVNNWEKLDYREDRPTDIFFPITATSSWEDANKVVDLFEEVYEKRKQLGKKNYSDG